MLKILHDIMDNLWKRWIRCVKRWHATVQMMDRRNMLIIFWRKSNKMKTMFTWRSLATVGYEGANANETWSCFSAKKKQKIILKEYTRNRANHTTVQRVIHSILRISFYGSRNSAVCWIRKINEWILLGSGNLMIKIIILLVSVSYELRIGSLSHHLIYWDLK